MLLPAATQSDEQKKWRRDETFFFVVFGSTVFIILFFFSFFFFFLLCFLALARTKKGQRAVRVRGYIASLTCFGVAKGGDEEMKSGVATHAQTPAQPTSPSHSQPAIVYIFSSFIGVM